MKITLSIIDMIIIFMALQGSVMAGLLFCSAKRISSNKWLASFMLVIISATLVMEFFNSDLAWKYPLAIPFIPILRMTIGPLTYFYTRSLIYGDKKLNRKDYLHFLPIVMDMQPQLINLLYFTGILGIPGVTRIYSSQQIQQFLFSGNVLYNLPALCSLLIYTGLSYNLIHKVLQHTEPSTHKLKDLKWLQAFLYAEFALIIIFMAGIILTLISSWNNYFLFIPAISLVYWLGMATYFRQAKMSFTDVTEYNKPPVKIHFTITEAEKYRQQLYTLMNTDLIYLNPALKLDILAGRLMISEKLLSSLLNQHMGKNFNDFINEYRVIEAKKKLADPSLNHFTIAAIAADCGFNSLATFQRCFKQFTGGTPSQYQNSLKPQNHYTI
jgi:AraC-like DNA-binding protein